MCLGCIVKSKMAGSCDSCVLNILRNCLFSKVTVPFTFPSATEEPTSCSASSPYTGRSAFPPGDVLVCVRKYRTDSVVSMCISLVTHDVEHLCMCFQQVTVFHTATLMVRVPVNPARLRTP